MRYAGRALVAVAAALLVGVTAAIIGNVDVNNSLALLFIGPSLMLLGAWTAIEVTAAMHDLDKPTRRDDGPEDRP